MEESKVEQQAGNSVSRRSVLKAGAAVAWATPVVIAMTPQAALAVSPAPDTGVGGSVGERPTPSDPGATVVAAQPQTGVLADTGIDGTLVAAVGGAALVAGGAALAKARSREQDAAEAVDGDIA